MWSHLLGRIAGIIAAWWCQKSAREREQAAEEERLRAQAAQDQEEQQRRDRDAEQERLRAKEATEAREAKEAEAKRAQDEADRMPEEKRVTKKRCTDGLAQRKSGGTVKVDLEESEDEMHDQVTAADKCIATAQDYLFLLA